MKFKFLLIILLMTALFQTSFAGGTDFHSLFGARTVSLNGLYFAGADGITTTLNNPAGLVYLNYNSFEISIIDQLGEHRFKSNSGNSHVSFRNDDFSIGGGINWKFSSNFSAAISYAPVSDYRVEWPYLMARRNDSLSTLLSFGMFNRIQVNSITPSAAMKFGNFAVGLSANIYMINFNTAFPQSNDRWLQGNGVAAYQFEYKLDAWSYGFTLGLLADISDRLKIGATVRSGFTADLEGDGTSEMFSDIDSTDQVVNVTSEFEMPWLLGIGAVYSLSPDLKLNIDVQYSLWGSTQKKIDFTFNNSTWQNGLSGTDSVTGFNGSSFSFNNENTLQAGAGIEYFASENLVIRGGYRYTTTPNTIENYNLLFPNVDSHTLSAGLGLIEGDYSLDATVIYTKGIEREVLNSSSASSGKYKLDSIVPVLTLRYKF